MLGRWDNRPRNPANQRIILKIDGLFDFSSNRAILFKNDFFFLKDDAAAALKLASKNAFEAVT
jgi:hypothetical protein